MFTALLVIAILVLLIVVHELGHFVAAKIFGVRVEEFGVGYPPRAFTFGKLGDTEYTLNWIPFGGFVRLFGDEGQGQHGRGSLVDSPRWKQAIILVAGVAMNVVAAWALFALALHIGVPQIVQEPVAGQKARLIISDIVPGSPASAGGLQAGDYVTAIEDGKHVQLATLTPKGVVDFVSVRGGKPITISYMRADTPGKTTITPANAVVPEAAGRPALGVALALVAMHSEPWGQAMQNAFAETWSGLATVAGSLWSIILSALHGAPDLGGVVGPVGIVGYVGEASHNGIGAVILLAGLISLNLAVINLIPIPALDGGRLLILIVEGAMRRAAPRLALQLLNALGIGLILFLMIAVTYHDIGRLLV